MFVLLHTLSYVLFLCFVHFYVFLDDVELIYATPAMPAPAEIISVGSNTPKTKLRMARVVLPSQYMLPPYSRIVSSEDEDKLYQQIIKHHCDCAESRIKKYVQFFHLNQFYPSQISFIFLLYHCL